MKRIPEAVSVKISETDRPELERWSRSMKTEHRCLRQRARIVLLADAGRSTRGIAREVGCMPRTVSLWRGRYAREGLRGIEDRPRKGKPPVYTADTDR
jgi:transposase